MLSQNMTYILAKKTFDAFAEFLNPVNIPLVNSPGPIRGVRGPRLELFDALFDPVVDGNISDKVLDQWKSFQWLHSDRFIGRKITHARHAHQSGTPVDLRGTRTAFTSLAIPSHCQIMCAFLLDLVN